MHDLLHDPLIGIRTRAGPTRVNIPDLFGRLASGEIEDYTGLRAHQADPWHVFLVQIAASILARHPETREIPEDPAFWRTGLLELAKGCANAWELLVEDVTKSAFLQHPLADSEDLKRHFKPKALTPDELDILVTAKNHDLKRMRARADDPEAWIFALLCCQTTSGYFGKGNYGVVRMNSGNGSRPVVAMVQEVMPSARFREEINAVSQMRRKALGGKFGFRLNGVVLTWLTSWARDGHQHMIQDLDPWFVEAARPLRLVPIFDGIVALGSTTAARQIGPKTLENGDVGDPWTPINVADKKKGRSALTVAADGWTADRISALLFEQGFELTDLQRPRADMNGDAWFVGSVLVGGQGETEGFHRFAIPVPAKVRAGLLAATEKKALGKLSEELLSDAKEAGRALKSALISMAQGGPEMVNFDRKATVAWCDQVIADWSLQWRDGFFPALWRIASEDRSTVLADWRTQLVALARTALRAAEYRIPLPSARRYRSVVKAEGMLNGALRKKGLLQERERPLVNPEQENVA